MRPALAAACIVALAATSANAQFFDNFDGENGGAEALNYNSLTNWTVTNGTIDLIGNGGTYDFLPGNGLYIDLDGSTFDAGNLVSLTLNLAPGTYTFSYSLAGSQRSASPVDTVNVSFGAWNASHTLAYTDPFASFSSGPLTFVAPTSVTISFQDLGTDNQGLLLDNVRVAPTPGAGAALVIAGGASLRRRRR